MVQALTDSQGERAARRRRDSPAIPRGFRVLARDEGGLSTVEYILILVLVAVVGFVTWRLFGASVGQQVDEARGGITTLETSNEGAGGARGTGAAGSAGAGSAAGGGALPPSADLANPSAEASAGSSVQAPTQQEDRDPVATQRGSFQAGAGRVTPLRSDGLPSAGDPSAGRGGGGWWKVTATIVLVILLMLGSIPLLARLRK